MEQERKTKQVRSAHKTWLYAITDFTISLDLNHCTRKPDRTRERQVVLFRGKRDGVESHTERMKRRIDSTEGKRMIAARFATVEPVFGNLRHNKRLTRFTLRGREKVDGQ